MFCPNCGQEQASESVRFCSRCGFRLNGSEEAIAKRLIMMTMYLALTICAMAGWASITSGPGYMQVRVIITLIAAITFYLLFARDLKRIFHKLYSQNIAHVKPGSSESDLQSLQSATLPALGSSRKYSRDGAAGERYRGDDCLARQKQILNPH